MYILPPDVDSIMSLYSLRVLKLSNSKSSRALKLSLFERLRVMKFQCPKTPNYSSNTTLREQYKKPKKLFGSYLNPKKVQKGQKRLKGPQKGKKI